MKFVNGLIVRVKNIGVSARVSVLFGLVLLVMLGYSTRALDRNWKQRSQMEEVERLTLLAAEISSAVHELQKERGLSAGYLLSGGSQFGEALRAQRARSDVRLSELQNRVRRYDPDGESGADAYRLKRRVKSSLAGLGRARFQVDEHRAGVEDMFFFYNNGIARLLDIVALLPAASSDNQVVRDTFAYVSFLHFKDLAGQERAAGSALLVGGFDRRGLIRRFLEIDFQQKSHFERFRAITGREEARLFDQVMSGPSVEEVTRLREVLRRAGSGGGEAGIPAEHWYKAATERIELLKKFENTLHANLIKLARSRLAAARAGFLWTLAEFAVVILLLGLSVRELTRDIAGRRRTETELIQHREHLGELVRRRTVELNRAREEAEEASSAKTRFLAAASHDLRQPLQAAHLLVNLLAETPPGEETRELVDKLKTAIESLGTLLNSLLDISKLYAGLIIPKKRTFQIEAELFRKLRQEIEPLAAERGIRVTIRSSPFYAGSDPELIEQVLRNLIYNALKFSPRGRVLVGCRPAGPDLRVQVWDTGTGIPDEHREKIFEEFFQTDSRDSRRGLGLGLALVKRLAALLGHRLRVQSWPGRGSMFEIVLPRAEGSPAPVAPDDSFAPPAAAKATGGLILLIEDDREILYAMRRTIQGWGYSVVACASVGEALAEQEKTGQVPDLIISDYQLAPDKTGTQAIEEIRRRSSREIPGLLVTGDTSPTRLLEANRSGLEILHKPVGLVELRGRLEHFLGQSDSVSK